MVRRRRRLSAGPPATTAIAAHPEAIVAEDRCFTRPFGDNARFDRAEKLIILLDKYDALRRRGRRGHAEAILWLRKRVHESSHFRGDLEFSTLISDLDAVASSG